MKLKTINVVMIECEDVKFVYSFSDDKDGDIEARQLFEELAKKMNFDEEEIRYGLEEGFLNADECGLYLIKGK